MGGLAGSLSKGLHGALSRGCLKMFGRGFVLEVCMEN